MRILIVDDDYVSSRLLNTILSPFGECDGASDGLSAIAQVEKALEENKPYDLICLDIMLPEMDGHDVLKKVREFENKHDGINNHAKVIMITALGDAENIKMSFGEQADAYMVKPIYKDKLIETIRKMGLFT